MLIEIDFWKPDVVYDLSMLSMLSMLLEIFFRGEKVSRKDSNFSNNVLYDMPMFIFDAGMSWSKIDQFFSYLLNVVHEELLSNYMYKKY